MVICFWLMDWRFPKIDQILSKMIFSFPYMITNYLCFLFSFQVSLKNGSDGEIRWAWSQNCSGNILVIGFTKFYFNPFFILGCFERIFLVSKKTRSSIYIAINTLVDLIQKKGGESISKSALVWWQRNIFAPS